jgi:hypothetical protein
MRDWYRPEPPPAWSTGSEGGATAHLGHLGFAAECEMHGRKTAAMRDDPDLPVFLYESDVSLALVSRSRSSWPMWMSEYREPARLGIPFVHPPEILGIGRAAEDPDGELERWPYFFTQDCLYNLILLENFEPGLPVPLIYCEGRDMLFDRVVAIRETTLYVPRRMRCLGGIIRLPLDRTRRSAPHGKFRAFSDNGRSALGAFPLRQIS